MTAPAIMAERGAARAAASRTADRLACSTGAWAGSPVARLPATRQPSSVRLLETRARPEKEAETRTQGREEEGRAGVLVRGYRVSASGAAGQGGFSLMSLRETTPRVTTSMEAQHGTYPRVRLTPLTARSRVRAAWVWERSVQGQAHDLQTLDVDHRSHRLTTHRLLAANTHFDTREQP